jgi:hypothetical protein
LPYQGRPDKAARAPEKSPQNRTILTNSSAWIAKPKRAVFFAKQ